MGVDAHIYLPTDVDARHAVEVLGILAGLPKVREPLGLKTNQTHVRVIGAKAESTCIADMARLVVKAPEGKSLVDGEPVHHAGFHHHVRFRSRIYGMVHPRSTPFWCAVGKRMVKWFGGVLIFNDCDAEEGGNVFRAKRSCPTGRHGFLPDDGSAWDRYHDALSDLAPVDEQALDAMKKNRWVAYKKEVSQSFVVYG